MLFSGFDSSPLVYHLAADRLAVDQRHPKLGGRVVLGAAIETQAGQPFVLAFSTEAYPGIPVHSTPLGTTLLPLADTPLLHASLHAGLWRVLSPTGRATWTLSVPLDPVLAYRPLFAAGFTVTSTGIGAISDAVRLYPVP
jgi:hypothetical protein